MSEQLVAWGFDEQYFHNGVHRYLADLLKLKKIHFTHDFAHRMQLAEKDSQDAGTKVDGKTQYYHEFVNKAIKLISDVLSDIRFGKKFERVLEAFEKCPDDQFYKLDSFSTTRFAMYSARVFKAFVLDLKPIVMALEDRAADKNRNKEDATTAQQLLNSLLSLKTMADLAGIADAYQELGSLSRTFQKVNSLQPHVGENEMKSTLSSVEGQTDEPPQEQWPLLGAMWPQLLKN